jgi:addiction module HigA family antidote
MKKIRVRNHPGEVLREEYLIPLGMSASALAREIGVPANRISDLIRERRGMTADTAIRLERYFGLKAETWLGL